MHPLEEFTLSFWVKNSKEVAEGGAKTADYTSYVTVRCDSSTMELVVELSERGGSTMNFHVQLSFKPTGDQ